MKGGVAMMISAFLRAKAEGRELPGEVILAIVGDEEAAGEHGARFLVEQHPEHLSGVRYALGEFGGFSLVIGKRRFYPIMVAEKQICWMKATLRGPGGHGSLPVRGGAMARLARFLRQQLAAGVRKGKWQKSKGKNEPHLHREFRFSGFVFHLCLLPFAF